MISIHMRTKKKDCMFKCYYGRKFTTVCGLNVHKRSCHIFDVSEKSDLTTETVEENNLGSEFEIDIETVPKNLLKPGIKLPRNDNGWEQPNDFLKNNQHGDLENSDVNTEIINFQSIKYDFFANSYGAVDTIHSEFDKKYINSSKNELKKTLKHLKSLKPPLQEIKYISQLLRNRYHKKENESFDHQSAYKSNFWKYCKKVFQPHENRVKPDFNEQDCYNYFRKTPSEKKQLREYSTPSWMQKLDILSVGFHL